MSKARGKRTGVTVATFAPVRYFGEYGVVAEEPRPDPHRGYLSPQEVARGPCRKEVVS